MLVSAALLFTTGAASAMRLDLGHSNSLGIPALQSQAESPSKSQAVTRINTILVNSTADTVNATNGYCTLRDAIRATNSNTASGAVPGECGADSSTVTDTTNFSVTGIIKLASTLPLINGFMTVDGTGQSLTISGEGKARVFSVPAAGTLDLKDLMIANGVGGQNGINTPPIDIYGGGIIFNRDSIVTITSATVENNRAPRNTYGDGGAIANWAAASGKPGMIEIHNSIFQANHADRWGGAIYVDHCGTLEVNSTTLDSNQATAASGGGIDNLSNVIVVNSTFFHNHAAANGGGIRNGSSGALSVTNSTFSNNDASHGGGIANPPQPAKATFNNTIVANSPSGGNCTGAITNEGGNLSWPDTTCPSIYKDPRLGALQDNGGPTNTMALLVQPVPPPPCAVIDMGLPPGTDCTDHPFVGQPQLLKFDQRGFPRRVDGDNNGILTCDTGAYEFGPALTTGAVTGVSVGEKTHDTATIKDLVNPASTGKITFKLYTDARCQSKIFIYTTPGISGDGSYSSGDYTTTAAGSYYWIASSSGNGNNNSTATKCGDPGETSVVNAKPIAELILKKKVTRDNDSTAVPTDWMLSATDPAPLQVIACSGQGEARCNVSAGTYTLSESGPSGYTASAWIYEKNSGAPVSGSSISLSGGEIATCTITNDDQAAHLMLRKTVINYNGGTATCSLFTLSAVGPTPLSSQCQVEGDVNVGTYNLSEIGPSGYNASNWACQDGDQIDDDTVTLGLGNVVNCTITNNDQPQPQAFITVVKDVTNDNGGSAVPDDFNLTLDGQPVLNGVRVSVDPGTHTAGETMLPGYTFEGFGGDCDSNGNVIVAAGDDKTWMLTNNDIPAPPIKVTGGGQIPIPNPTSKKQATFGFIADQTEAGSMAATGHFNYVNHESGLHINGSVTEIKVIARNPDGTPKTVQFSGTCDGNGPACTFVVTVEDHGEPGTSDEFAIRVTGDVNESQSQRVISKGNVQFHVRQAKEYFGMRHWTIPPCKV